MILQKIKENRVAARKEKNELAYKTYTFILGEIERLSRKSADAEATDAECMSVINKAIKANTEMYAITFSNDLVEETKLLEALLPKMASEAEMVEALNASGFSTIKEGMSVLEKKFGAAFEKKVAISLIQERLKL